MPGGGSESATSIIGTNLGTALHATDESRKALRPPSEYGSRVQNPSWMRSPDQSGRKEPPLGCISPHP